MNDNNPTIPTQNITVSFVRLQDMGEFADFQNLLQCKLCDTINVIFPDYNSSGQFKIVKTVWDVLAGRYDEMELGDLSISLSDALGITQALEKSSLYVEPDDYIVDEGTSGNWTYRKYNSGIGECWGHFTFSGVSATGVLGSAFNYATITSAPNFPFTFISAPVVSAGEFKWGSGIGFFNIGGVSTTKVTTLWIFSTNVGDKSGYYAFHAIGKWR